MQDISWNEGTVYQCMEHYNRRPGPNKKTRWVPDGERTMVPKNNINGRNLEENKFVEKSKFNTKQNPAEIGRIRRIKKKEIKSLKSIGTICAFIVRVQHHLFYNCTVYNFFNNFDFRESFVPFLSKGKINSEFTTVKQPLNWELKRLPLAHIDLELSEVGLIKTRAAMAPREIEMNHYLLGNGIQLQNERGKSVHLKVMP